MNPIIAEDEAREVLGDWIQDNGSLWSSTPFVSWRVGETDIELDGYGPVPFSVRQLSALHWWITNRHRSIV